MPVSRLTAEGLSGEVAAAYGRAEVRLLGLMARHLERGHGAPDWAEAKLAELQLFRKRADKIMAEVTAEAVGQAAAATQSAYLRGTAAGQGDLLRAGIRLDSPPQQAERAVEALTRAQAGTLEDIGPRVVRQTADAYRDAVVRASSGTLSGAATRVQDAQVVLDDLARRGVTGFTDTAGRAWGLESYVDMATRTTTAQAAVAGHLDRLEQGGLPLVIVSTSSRECELCRPWEGKVLSRGPLDAMATNVVTGKTEQVRVDGTVQEATRAGLFHPNCTHNLSGYVHGATRRVDAVSNPKGYAEKQQQRALERKVREWKRREAAAMTPEAKRKARGKVREWQGRVREHVEATGLPRKPRRESFDVHVPVPKAHPLDGVDLGELDQDVLDGAMADLMAAEDYGPRFERVAAELDRRDQVPAPVALAPEPDTRAEQAALDRLLFGDTEARDLTTNAQAASRDPEKALRDEYDTWTHTQWLRAEDEASRGGTMLTPAGKAKGYSELDLFTGRISLKWATPELQEWFSLPGNQRLSFPEYRASLRDDKAARKAAYRLRNRGFESEYG